MMSRDARVGAFISERRVGRALTLDQLAVATGVDARTVERWESDEEQPSDAQLARLSRALKVPMDELFDLAGRSLADPEATGFTP